MSVHLLAALCTLAGDTCQSGLFCLLLMSSPSLRLNRHHDTSPLLGVICKGMLDFGGRRTWTLVWASLGFWCLKIRLFSFVQWMAYSLIWKHSVGLHFCMPLPFCVRTWEARFHCEISFSSAHADCHAQALELHPWTNETKTPCLVDVFSGCRRQIVTSQLCYARLYRTSYSKFCTRGRV